MATDKPQAGLGAAHPEHSADHDRAAVSAARLKQVLQLSAGSNATPLRPLYACAGACGILEDGRRHPVVFGCHQAGRVHPHGEMRLPTSGACRRAPSIPIATAGRWTYFTVSSFCICGWRRGEWSLDRCCAGVRFDLRDGGPAGSLTGQLRIPDACGKTARRRNTVAIDARLIVSGAAETVLLAAKRRYPTGMPRPRKASTIISVWFGGTTGRPRPGRRWTGQLSAAACVRASVRV